MSIERYAGHVAGRMWSVGVALGLALAVLAGCAASPVSSTSSLPAPRSTPAGGQALTSWGLTVGPAGLLWLPAGTTLTYSAQQPNLLIAAGPAAEAGAVQAYLRATLPGLGWHVTADADGGMLFDQGEWQGAYALGGSSWALTVRND